MAGATAAERHGFMKDPSPTIREAMMGDEWIGFEHVAVLLSRAPFLHRPFSETRVVRKLGE